MSPMRSFRIEELKLVDMKAWKARPVTLWAVKCPVVNCGKIITSTDSAASNRRAKYIVHLNWSHNHIRRRDRGDVADAMRRAEVSMEVP